MRTARSAPLDCRPMPRAQVTATGATEGSIIAAIIASHSTRNSGSAIPIVPGSIPMPRACPTVNSQARAAITTIRPQARARSFAGISTPVRSGCFSTVTVRMLLSCLVLPGQHTCADGKTRPRSRAAAHGTAPIVGGDSSGRGSHRFGQLLPAQITEAERGSER